MKARCWLIVAALLSGLVLGKPQSPATRQDSSVVYADITAASGLKFRHRSSATPQKYLIETMSGGVALLDFDGDGWLDVFFVNGARLQDPQLDGLPLDKSATEFWNRLYRNNQNGTFTDVTVKAGLQGKGYGMGVATADYDNDGRTDLLVTGYGDAALYHNNGDGRFSDVTLQAGLMTQGWMTSAGFFDYDRDGYLDLFICRYLDWSFQKSIPCGQSKERRSYCHPDMFKPISNYLFKNNRDGTFTDVSAATGIRAEEGKALGVAFADFDNDGWTDISVANDSFQQFLFKNEGNGKFTEMAAIAGAGYTEDGKTFAGMGTDFADVDDDGFPDIVTTALSNQRYAYFHNNGDSSFNYATYTSNLAEITRLFAGWGMRIFDYDNDGIKDLFLANSHVMDDIQSTQPNLSYLQKPLLLKNTGKTFADVSSQSGSVFSRLWASRGAAFGDLDNDGDIDVVVSNCDGPAYVLRNDGGNHNVWIGLELRGVRNNRDGLGAKVILIRDSGKAQHQFVSTAASYLSANDRRVFFGLGKENKIRSITIHWPSGKRQLLKDPTPGQLLKIEEVTE